MVVYIAPTDQCMQALAIMALGMKEKVASRCDILSFYRGRGKIQHRSRVAEVSATSPLVSTKREAIAVISSSALDLVASDNASDLVLRAMRHTGHRYPAFAVRERWGCYLLHRAYSARISEGSAANEDCSLAG